MKKIGIIIQARMDSLRLPGKVLMKLGNMSLLEFLIKRLKWLNNNFGLIVATTTNKKDKKIVKLCQSLNVNYFCGSEENVLKRYVDCAQKFSIDIIIRICADCPFVSLQGIDQLTRIYFKNPNADLIHNKDKNGYPFGTGVELVKLEALKQAEKKVATQYQKEHVLPYILENPDKFKIIKVNTPEDIRRTNYYLTVDYPEDLKLARKILAKIKNSDKTKIPLRKIIKLLDKNPNIAKINSLLHEGYIG